MSHYRAYIIGQDGDVNSVILDCANDDAAIEAAKQLVDGHDIELWQLDRQITKFAHKSEATRIIQHPDCFEVRSEDGLIVRKFVFDDDASRRAISNRMTRKQAFEAARNFAGKRYTVETAKS